jgi:hypothetical protein
MRCMVISRDEPTVPRDIGLAAATDGSFTVYHLWRQTCVTQKTGDVGKARKALMPRDGIFSEISRIETRLFYQSYQKWIAMPSGAARLQAAQGRTITPDKVDIGRVIRSCVNYTAPCVVMPGDRRPSSSIDSQTHICMIRPRRHRAANGGCPYSSHVLRSGRCGVSRTSQHLLDNSARCVLSFGRNDDGEADPYTTHTTSDLERSRMVDLRGCGPARLEAW